MKKRIRKIVTAVLCSMVCISLFAGCSWTQSSEDMEDTAGSGGESSVDFAESVETDGAGGSAESAGGDALQPAEGSDSGDLAELESGGDVGSNEGQTAGSVENTDYIGEFSMQDIDGESYTQEMFADYDVTMVNVFTTWCTPCINEIPYLEQLNNDMADQGVRVVGIVLDAVDGYGNVDEEAVEKAGLLAERTGAAYPFLIPDDTWLNGRLYGINAVPETFFVDCNGAVIGESYTGSRSLEEWKAVVEEKLSDVSGAAE